MTDYDKELNTNSARVVKDNMNSVLRVNAATQNGLSLPQACSDCKESILAVGSCPSASVSPKI